MSRPIMFSRTFPAYHPKAGQPTGFIEKIFNGIEASYINRLRELYEINSVMKYCSPDVTFFESLNKQVKDYKYHTIRAGNRWKVGDTFSPRVWIGKPYRSKQIPICPDIKIKKVWDFEIINSTGRILIGGKGIGPFELERLAKNDGLTLAEMFKWFKWPTAFKGQVICWADHIEY